MLTVEDFLNIVKIVFYVVGEASIVKSRIRFDLVLKRGVESFSDLSETNNSSNIEKTGSDHPTW